MVTMEELREVIPGKYQLAVVASQRLKQINRGALPLVETDLLKPSMICLEEIAAKKVEFKHLEPKAKKKKKK